MDHKDRQVPCELQALCECLVLFAQEAGSFWPLLSTILLILFLQAALFPWPLGQGFFFIGSSPFPVAETPTCDQNGKSVLVETLIAGSWGALMRPLKRKPCCTVLATCHL